jgi:hypothetical protein
MKKLGVLAVFAATTSVAHAFDYKINLESRADFVNATNKTTSTAATPVTTTDKYNNFANNMIRFNMVGTINENLTYRFRYRFLNSPPAPHSSAALGIRQDTATAVDFLYVDHKNSMFTTRLGKQKWDEVAGRESFVAGTDGFATSAAFSNFKTAMGEYRYAATAMYKIPSDLGNLNIALSNPNSTFSDASGLSTAPERKNTGLAYGVYYTGSFMSKMIQPVLAYTSASQNGDTDIATTATVGTKDVNYTMVAYGLRSEVAGAIIDADYKTFTKPDSNRGLNVTNANKEQKSKSMVLTVAYPVGEFVPMAAYINDKYETADLAGGSNANYKRSSFVVGTMWKPFADTNFRYHLAYTSAVTDYDAATSTRTAASNSKVDFSSITLGFKIDM